jgi:hypothetical protein
MKLDCFTSTERFADRITGLPLREGTEIVDLGVLPIPGLFFPTPDLATRAKSHVRVVRAHTSGLIQLDRDIRPELYAYYKSGRINDAHLAHIEKTADELYLKHGNNASVLEIGGGAGYLMRALVHRGFQNLFVIDPSGENKEGQGYQVIQGLFPADLEKIDLKFQVIIGQHFLEHSADPIAVLEAARDLLDVNGEIWIEVPDIESSAKSEDGEWLSAIYALHSTYFSRETLEIAGLYAGLRLVRSAQVDHYGKSITGVFTKSPHRCTSIVQPPDAKAGELDEIRNYFHNLGNFGRCLPAGLMCWGAAERCLTVLGACMAGGFQPGRIIDSNPDLQGLYLSGMKEPILAPHEIPNKISAILILSIRNAHAIIQSNASRFDPHADIYIPFLGVRNINDLL